MKLNNYKSLNTIAKQFGQSKLLFSFVFVNISFKCVLFVEANTLLFSIVKKNISCLVSLTNSGAFNGKLPSEFYYSIRKNIIAGTDKDNITQLWSEFDAKLAELKIEDIKEITKDQVINLLRTTRTDDKKYDIEGQKPYFSTWRRNKEHKVSPENLFKTEKYFGLEVKLICEKNNISSVWLTQPTKNSLNFLDNKSVIAELKN